MTRIGHSASPAAPLTTALEDGRPHHKPKHKQDHKGDEKDEEEHLGDPGSGHRDSGEAEHASDDRNDEENKANLSILSPRRSFSPRPEA